MRTPTERQYHSLRALGSGAAGLSVTKRRAEPLIHHGWVTADWRPPYYQWMRITPNGLRALALAVEKFGLPSLEPKTEVRVCAGCGYDWNPKCRCGSRSYRYEEREVAA